MKRYRIFVIILLFTCVPITWAQEEKHTDLTELGNKVPAFSVTTLDGQKFNSHELITKATLINFFATWCGSCNQELPHLEVVEK